MMRDRKIIVLSIVLAVLVIIYVLGSIFTRPGRQQRVHSVSLLTPLERESVSSFKIVNGTENLTLSIGEDGSWRIVSGGGNFPAAEDKVDRFLETLLGTRTLRFATGDEELFSEFSVAESGRYIQFLDAEGELIKRLVLSETTAGSEGQTEETGALYVRIQPDERIYQIEDDLFFYVKQERNYWADLNLFPSSVNSESVLRADVEGDFTLSDGYRFRDSYTLVERVEDDERRWEILPRSTGTEGPAADQAEIERVITSLAELKAFAFAQDQRKDGKGFGGPAASIRFETGGGKEYRIVIGVPADGEGSRYLEVAGTPYVYLVKEWALKRIFKPRAELEREEDA